MISCPQCHATLPDSAKYCSNCGQPIADAYGQVTAPAQPPTEGGLPPRWTPPQPEPVESNDQAWASPIRPGEAPGPFGSTEQPPPPDPATPQPPASTSGSPTGTNVPQAAPPPPPMPPAPGGADPTRAMPQTPGGADPSRPTASPPGWPPIAGQVPPVSTPPPQFGSWTDAQTTTPNPHAIPGAGPAMGPQPGAGWTGAAPGPQHSSTSSQWQNRPAMTARGPDLKKVWAQFGGDWSRVCVSLLLMLLSLGLTWNYQGSALDNVWPLIAVLIALPVTLVDVVLQPWAIGRSYPPDQRLLLRFALVTPLILSVGWSILDLAINSAGFGAAPLVALSGAAVGVTGAVSQSDPRHARLWSAAAVGAFAVALVWVLVFVVKGAKFAADASSFELASNSWIWLAFLSIALGWGWHAYLAIRLGLRALRMHAEAVVLGWWLAATTGVWFLCMRLFTDVYDVDQSSIEILESIAPAAELFGLGAWIAALAGSGWSVAPVAGLISIGAILLTAASLRKAVPMPPGHAWLNAASVGLFVIGTAAVVQAVQLLLMISESPAKGVHAWMIVVLLSGAGGAWLTRAMLGRNPSTGRLPVLAFAAFFTAVFWLTYLIATNVYVSYFSISDAVLFMGPLAVVVCLFAPASVRQLLGPIGIPDALRGDTGGGFGGAPANQ